MFGNCPRSLWERWYQPDERHRILLACRALLVCEDSGRNVLLEAGIGASFEPRLRERYGVSEGENRLLRSLREIGLEARDVDVVVLSHLHFDHAGGVLKDWCEGEGLALAFPKARFLVGREAWERARRPHPRDRASFIHGLCELLEQSGRLELVESGATGCDTLGPAYRFRYSHGHTPGLMLTRVESPRGPIAYAADLVPGAAWVHLPITMGYDRYPELLIDEKRALLDDLVREQGWIFFAHDPEVAACKITRDGERFLPTEKVSAVRW